MTAFRSVSSTRLAVAAGCAAVLLLHCGGGGADGVKPDAKGVRIQVTPPRAELTVGQQMQLTAQVLGASNQAARWSVVPAEGGSITPQGLYTAPRQPGVFLVRVQAAAAAHAVDHAEIKVWPAPAAERLNVDKDRIKPGETVTFLPEFTGGDAVLLPVGLRASRGVAIRLTPLASQTYTLRVTNPAGAVAELQAQVRVDEGPVPVGLGGGWAGTPLPVPGGGATGPGQPQRLSPGDAGAGNAAAGAAVSGPVAPSASLPAAGPGSPAASGTGGTSAAAAQDSVLPPAAPGVLFSGPTAELALSYQPGTFAVDAEIPAQAPILTPPGAAAYALASGRLPDGLQLNKESGVITGTPSAEGSFVFRITAQRGERITLSPPIAYTVAGTQAFDLVYPAVAGEFPTRVPIPPQVPAALPGDAAFAVTAGGLPPGLQLGVDGSLTGAPRVPGVYTFTITALAGAGAEVRRPAATLTYTIVAGPLPRLAYKASATFDTQSVVAEQPVLENLPDPAANRYSLASGALPPGLEFGTEDPFKGVIAGTPTQEGEYTFTLRVDDGIDQAVSNPITYRIRPFQELKITALAGTPAVVKPGQPVTLAWTVEGLPTEVTLKRNPVAEAVPGLAPGLAPGLMPAEIPVPVNPDGGTWATAVNVPSVWRRQKFTLTLNGHPNPVTASTTVASEGVEVVAGDPDYAHPPQTYADGPAGTASYRNVKGAAYHDGKVFLAEGPDQTIRVVQLADGSMTRFAGVPMGPAVGLLQAAADRLNLPGALAVAGNQMYVCDVGSHTVKTCPVDDPSAMRVLAGLAGQSGNQDGIGAAARFGTLMDLSVHPGSGLLFVTDLEHGIRMVNPATGAVKTLAYTPRQIGLGAWPQLQRPVAAAVAADGNVYLTTERQPGHPHLANTRIQVLRPDGADLWNAAWTLGPFAGSVEGYADVPALGALDQARFKAPVGLAVIGHELFVADRGNSAIRKIDLRHPLPGGVAPVTTVAGDLNVMTRSIQAGFRDDPANKAQFLRPTRVMAGADHTLLVLDQEETALRVISALDDPAQARVTTVGGIRVRAAAGATMDGEGLPDRPGRDREKEPLARLKRPASVAVDRGTGVAYIVEPALHTVRAVVLDGSGASGPGRTGSVTTFAGKLRVAGPAADNQDLHDARFTEPTEIGIDGQARLFVLEPKGGRIRMLNRGKVTTFLDGLHLPAAAPGQEPRLHLAVRPGGHGLALAYSTYQAVGGQPAGWRVLIHLDGATEEVLHTGEQEPGPLAVDLTNRVHVLMADRQRQTCTVHTYQQVPAPGAAGPGQWQEIGARVFGPGAAVGRDFGFPDIQAMAVDSKGNLFLTDQANALIWEIAVQDGAIFPLVGRPCVQQFTGTATRGFDAPIYMPAGVAATGADDLVCTSGDAVLQVSAPGTQDHPYQPALAVPWTAQPRRGRAGAGRPAPAQPGGQRPALFNGAAVQEALENAHAAIARGNVNAAKAAYRAVLEQLKVGPQANEARAYLAAHPDGAAPQ